MDQMNQRLDSYGETLPLQCAPGETILPDDGLFMDVVCSITCKGQNPRIERSRGAFIPKDLGLSPGNGSTDQNTLWSSVGVALKSWSEDVCLEKATEACKSLEEVHELELTELESGEWKLQHFPGCKEKKAIRSPFDNTSGSKRMLPMTSNLLGNMSKPLSETKFHLKGLKLSIPFADLEKKDCAKKIKAHICYGDCIDMTQKDAIVETLGTPEPLGAETVEICADELAQGLSHQKISQSVKQKICENYFWKSYINSNSFVKSCAALRGEVNCEGLK